MIVDGEWHIVNFDTETPTPKEQSDPIAVAYKQGWTAARDEWEPRAEKAEADAAIGWNEASVEAAGRRAAETELADIREQLIDARTALKSHLARCDKY